MATNKQAPATTIKTYINGTKIEIVCNGMPYRYVYISKYHEMTNVNNNKK